MVKCQCKLGGYVYDPEEGEPRSKVEAGTAFDDLPDKWRCPSCGVKKKMFKDL
ncbi:MAG: rubredoxin [Methanobacteriales archaeon Met13]